VGSVVKNVAEVLGDGYAAITVEHQCGRPFGRYQFYLANGEIWMDDDPPGQDKFRVPGRPSNPNTRMFVDHSKGWWGPLVGRGRLVQGRPGYVEYQCGCMPKPRSRRVNRMGNLPVNVTPDGYKLVID
jgi:hypothetical protein